jgi:lactoylglutathione lyase/glyoxylase I family protein
LILKILTLTFVFIILILCILGVTGKIRVLREALMDSGKKHDGDVDVFDPTGSKSGSVSSLEHIETETNVYSMDTLRRAAAQHGGTDSGAFEVSAIKQSGGTDSGAFEVSTGKQSGGTDSGAFEVSAGKQSGGTDSGAFEVSEPKHSVADTDDDGMDDPLEDDFPQEKGGFFAKLFRFGSRGKDVNLDDDLPPDDDLSLNDSVLIAPPPPTGRLAAAKASDSGVFEFKPSTAEAASEASDEPAPVSTVPEVTDSGVFEFKPSTAETASEASDKPAPVSTTPEVTDSGVFEFKPSTSGPVSESSDEPEPVGTVPEVTDSGVFEFKPSTSEPVSESSDEPAPVSTVPEVTDSGVFEFKPSTTEPVSESSDEPAPVSTTPEVTDSGVFELGPAAAEPHPHGAHKGSGDEWEIGWEPEGDGSSGASGAAAAADAPPPVFTRFAHVCLYVKDLGRSVEFYNKLGFQKRFVFNRNGSVFGAYLEFGDGNFIELFEDVSRSAAAALGRLAHFCLETPDIDATMESLSARGIGFSPKKLGSDSTYQIWLKDPDGNEFEIHQYTAESSQIVGGEVEADW